MRQRLDLELIARGLFESRAKARAAIEAGTVRVNGAVAAKPADLVDDDAAIVATPAHPWVGRGGVKLDHALSLWPVAVAGRTVLDVGASTGGFTQVCLTRGAAKVFAVDVGHGQLHDSLRQDPHVVALEGLDARSLTRTTIPDAIDLIVTDVSFISLTKALPTALALAAPGADLVALVKPQFEAGPEAVGKGGLVRDPAARDAALASVTAFLETSGWSVRATAPSPIQGGDGNHEWLLWARRAG
jgi:23S rRNA (cytidine1920-2'-O)/16S rRNA (cytidine1409-2'-O)-methyltransferase